MSRFTYLFLPILLVLFSVQLAHGQQREVVAGVVLQADGRSPIPDASVLNINTRKGTYANERGAFLLGMSMGDTLLVRAIGFKPRLLTGKDSVTPGNRLTIALEADTMMLEVVDVVALPTLQQLKMMKPLSPSNAASPRFPLPPEPEPRLPSPSVGGPIGALYNLLSKEGKELRKLKELQQKQKQREEQAEREAYNKYFKENEGYQ